MENKERSPFKEGIKSYRKRLENELKIQEGNLIGFDNDQNSPLELRHLIRHYRHSLDKCNLYIGEIESLVEKEIKNEHERSNKEIVRENIK